MSNSPHRRIKALVSYCPEEERLVEVIGTGIEVADGFVLTARHVVDYFFQQFDGLKYDQMGQMKMNTPAATRGLFEGTLTSKGRIICVSLDLENRDFIFQAVAGISGIERTELGIIQTHGPEFSRRTGCPIPSSEKVPLDLDFRPPRVGLEVVSWGYPGGKVEGRRAAQLKFVEESGPVFEVNGNIEEGGNGFPQFLVQMNAAPGMSGAPVIDKVNGRLIGLVSKNIFDRTRVAMLWPLGVGEVLPGRTLADLRAESLVVGVDLDRVVTLDSGISEYRPSGEIGDGRCFGREKDGSRCPRPAEEGASRCSQHPLNQLDEHKEANVEFSVGEMPERDGEGEEGDDGKTN